MAISVGGTLFHEGYSGAGYTYVYNYNPANATGILNTVNIDAYTTGITGLVIGVTATSDSPEFTSRDYATIGNVSAGEQQITGLSIDVVINDVLMIYNSGGNWSYTGENGYSTYIYYYGNGIDGTTHTYTLYASGIRIALNATGTETAAGQPLKNVFGRPFRGCFR